MNNYKFAAFVMTYERSELILQTIEDLKTQSFPPQIILIVDNSISNKTKEIIYKQNFDDVIYHKMEYNTGPAGAAYYGLKELTLKGYDWIYWGDDDNPPKDYLIFENLFNGIDQLTSNNIKLGIIGGKGGIFNKITGRIRSLSNYELQKDAYLEVDSIPGGHAMIVNSDIIKRGIMPDEELFFGFEEFDFCLKVKENNFKLYVAAERWLRVREKALNVQENYQWKHSNLGNVSLINREYYSTRNLLRIFYDNKFYIPFLYLNIKSVGKMIYGFRYGIGYGTKLSRSQYLALKHFYQNEYGALTVKI